MATFPPTADLPLRNWAQNASDVLTATPTVYGCTAGDATSVAALLADYILRLETATTPATRTKGSIAAKNTSKTALLTKLRQVVKTVNNYAPVTPQQRIDFGLNPKDVSPTPVPVPGTAPVLRLTPDGVLELRSVPGSARPAKAPGTVGAVVRTCLLAASAPPPASLDQTQFAMIATRGRVALPLPPGADAKKLYAFAQWFNERGELGPISDVAVTTIAVPPLAA
jgi:hypothetical protein